MGKLLYHISGIISLIVAVSIFFFFFGDEIQITFVIFLFLFVCHFFIKEENINRWLKTSSILLIIGFVVAALGLLSGYIQPDVNYAAFFALVLIAPFFVLLSIFALIISIFIAMRRKKLKN